VAVSGVVADASDVVVDASDVVVGTAVVIADASGEGTDVSAVVFDNSVCAAVVVVEDSIGTMLASGFGGICARVVSRFASTVVWTLVRTAVASVVWDAATAAFASL